MSVRPYLHLFLVAVMALAILVPASVMAAPTVGVRGGEHKTYSRLVFDWATPTAYSVEKKSEADLRIVFKQNAELDLKALDVTALNNIVMIQEISTSPLAVMVQIPPGSPYKHFTTGNRVVVDVLEPSQKPKPEDKQPKAGKPEAEQPPAPQKPEDKKQPATAQEPAPIKITPEESPAKETKADDTKVEKESTAPVLRVVPASEPVKVPDVETAAPVEAPKTQLISLDKDETEPTVVAISSVSPTNMAIFRLHNKIWMVNDKEKFLISPHFSGPQAKALQPVEEIDHPAAKIFTMRDINDAYYLAQGGGLVWRLLIGNQDIIPPSYTPIQPRRRGVSRDTLRGGRVIWPFKDIGEIIDYKDPESGVTIKIVTVGHPEDLSPDIYEFIDFKTLPSPLGLAIWPKVDDLVVEKTEDGVEIYRPSGLAVMPQSEINLANEYKLKAAEFPEEEYQPRTFEFQDWQLGDITTLSENQNVILSRLPSLPVSEQVEGFLSLGKMYLSHGMGAEAIGYFENAQRLMSDLTSNADFKAMMGVALALNGQYEPALPLLSDPLNKDKYDVRFWRSYVLANLQDWQQAEALLPARFTEMYEYPTEIAVPLALTLAETALRAGDLLRGEELFSIAESHEKRMRPHYKAAFDYLKGEAYRQNGDIDQTVNIWKKLSKGKDDLYNVKAALALTRLEVEERGLPLSEAVDRLERIRYSWRGDDLEAQVNYWLGRIYFDYEEYVKGLNIMRDAAAFATGPHLGQTIINDMTQEFSELFMSDRLNKLSAPDAAALYDRFSELIPVGPEGDQIAQRLAAYLTQANLYQKSAELLSYQLKNRLQGEEAFNVAKRLAGIYLLDAKPQDALDVLARAEKIKREVPELQNSPQALEDMALLKARALADTDHAEEALEVLLSVDLSPKVNRLRADIAWEHGFWEDAAEALKNYIEDQIAAASAQNVPADGLEELILQRAIALNLAGDRIRLANMRQRYTEMMEGSDRENIFEVITRPRRVSTLADRETLLSVVSEVDLFSEILNGYAKEE